MKTVYRIEYRLGVPAPPAVIWELLYDMGRWPEWNPLMRKAEGELKMGERLVLTEEVPGQPAEEVAWRVLDWTPENQILLQLNEMGGFIRRTRYIEIEKLTEEGCILSIGEDWAGRLARFTSKQRRRALNQGFRAFADRLRELATERAGARASA